MQVRITRIDRGSLDQEKVVIEALEDCNLGRYILFDTTYDENGIISNKHRHLFVFSNLDILKDDFVVLYTRQKREGDFDHFRNKRGSTTYNIFWDLGEQIWNNAGDKAYLVHYDAWEYKEA